MTSYFRVAAMGEESERGVGTYSVLTNSLGTL